MVFNCYNCNGITDNYVHITQKSVMRERAIRPVNIIQYSLDIFLGRSENNDTNNCDCHYYENYDFVSMLLFT